MALAAASKCCTVAAASSVTAAAAPDRPGPTALRGRKWQRATPRDSPRPTSTTAAPRGSFTVRGVARVQRSPRPSSPSRLAPQVKSVRSPVPRQLEVPGTSRPAGAHTAAEAQALAATETCDGGGRWPAASGMSVTGRGKAGSQPAAAAGPLAPTAEGRPQAHTEPSSSAQMLCSAPAAALTTHRPAGSSTAPAAAAHVRIASPFDCVDGFAGLDAS